MATFKFLPKLTKIEFFSEQSMEILEKQLQFWQQHKNGGWLFFLLDNLSFEELTHKYKFEVTYDMQSSLKSQNDLAMSSFKVVGPMRPTLFRVKKSSLKQQNFFVQVSILGYKQCSSKTNFCMVCIN